MNRFVAAQRAALRGGEGGGVLVLFAGLVALALLAVSAVAVDLGRTAVVAGDQQGLADRAALDTLLRLQEGGPAQDFEHIAATSLFRNRLSEDAGASFPTGLSTEELVRRARLEGLVVRPVSCGPEPGEVDDDLADGAWGDDRVNGVEVRTWGRSTTRFLPTPSDEDGPRLIERRAVACSQPIAAISAAGTTATIDDGLTGELLSSLSGGALDASLIGWNGLIGLGVTLGDLGTELGQIGVDVGAGTLTELLEADVTAGQLAQATARALQAGGDTAGLDATLLGALLGLDVLALPAFQLGELLQVSTSSEAALLTDLDALGLIVAGLQLANHQAAAVLDLEVPGVTGVRLSVIEPPAIAIGPPGFHGDGTPRTQARSAQLGLDLRLPIGTVRDAGNATEVDPTITALVQPFRDRIDAISTCSQALTQRSTSSGTVRSDLKAAIDELEAVAGAAGLLGVVDGLLDVVGALLGGLTGTLSCLLAPNSTRNSIKADLRAIADTFEQMLVVLSDELVLNAPSSGSTPALSVRLAQADHTLLGVECAEDGAAEGRVQGGAARVAFTDWAGGYQPQPAAVTVDLLDVDLGVLRAQIGIWLDTLLGSSVDEQVRFPGPHPTIHRQGTHVAGLSALAEGVTLEVSGTSVLGISLGAVADELIAAALAELDPVLASLDAALAPALEVLGAELGGVEAAALSTRCRGRALVR